MSSARGFDRIAPLFRTLERLAFQDSMQRARTAWLDGVPDDGRALLLGEGEGRLLRALLDRRPGLRIRVVEGSPAMARRAAARLAPSERERVAIEIADLREISPEPASCDLVAAPFVLDCFTLDTLVALIPRIAATLRPGGVLLRADFRVPGSGFARRRGRLWMALLHRAFRLWAGIEARRLVEPGNLLARAGLVLERSRSLRGGLLVSELWRKA